MNVLPNLTTRFLHLGAAKPRRHSRLRNPGNRLTLEVLEARVCLSSNPYAYVSSYKNSSEMRYDELTGMPEPANGKMGATLVDQGAGGLDSPLDVLLAPNGDLLVGSAEGQSIKRYDATTGDYLDDLIPGNVGLSFPTGFVFGPDYQSLYVANNGNNTIERYDYDGTHATNPTVFIQSSDLGAPAAVVFGPDGNLYVGSLNNSKVLRYDGQTGAPLPAPRRTGADFIPKGMAGLNRSGGIVFGPDGDLYVASQFTNSILRFNGISGLPDPAPGQRGADFVPSGSCGLSDPAGIIFGPGPDSSYQDLYIVSINTDNVLQADGQTGACSEFIAAGSGGLSAPRDLVFGSTDPSSLDYIPSSAAVTRSGLGSGVATGLVSAATNRSLGNPLAGRQALSQANPPTAVTTVDATPVSAAVSESIALAAHTEGTELALSDGLYSLALNGLTVDL